MEMAFEQELILVLDFGSQYNQLITRRIREMGVYSELHDHEISIEEIKKMNPKGIILSGGPNSVYEEGSFTVDPEIFNLGVPVMGICYGMQLMTKLLGGSVERANEREYGKAVIKAETHSLFTKLPEEQTVWMSHSDKVINLPEGFNVIAHSPSCKYAAIENPERNLYGVQFHPEVRHSEYGNDLLRNFIREICKCTGEWTMENFIEIEIEKIREKVGDRKVICAMSGGVDSSVVAVLIHKAIGDQLTCIFVDHGLLRKGEGDMVMKQFGEGFNMNIIRVDAKERFMSKLAGVSDPEQKRKIIGNEFVYLFDEEAAKLKDADFLAQGTLYTDIIESGTKTAQTIKSHHNVGGLPEDMQFELIEPVNTLFKDEVRALGIELGIPEHLVWRQPFPGPGLGIRVLGEITEEKLEIVRESDAILREVIAEEGLERDIWQYFTVLPDIRSVGVMGDYRTYDYTVGVRAVTSIDGMTSDFARIDWEVLQKVSSRIVNEVDHVNRVVYDITSKPPSTIEWE
ncbi:glutamine-hydrolyzing GMP synthase [Macrococcoides caseolyticum]|uniref:GMP synthase [glutamine-hydrolyzing] n=1 Tax=Macrococcus caseolyticus (strain JCSC5402) TaxID=458233 RepID=GUAA_MACCJ|nr:glutamine-hydrolyzing GMP synthase [Macrococcus caseolyticus]B9E8Y0.1 RecName: Full=GMP synthase [glutamine-hydrolyzing]; AltName: Full=GMP synthetase; AltName: Full=Glutamine amidotransferase [Macrococcus caseolyticus JCSC5402]MDJ1091329.1 glutamine-hydrolyzing GMP synthase [Macrococcus caseolyticus]MDJ1109205.1 glutamine-hydrolyzing GMP synthase [Macrococcus caseolyticus]MDJ1153603.1 glutamine-hydrolyzing GMP synthase [Macrococcus caseolyticus]MDJ1156190.1 glutamine-hydrolyzing GMP syntha